MDVHVLLDAIAKCMSSEETELNKVVLCIGHSYIHVHGCDDVMYIRMY